MKKNILTPKERNFSDVSVVMITRNEEEAVKKVVNDIKTFTPGAKILIIDSSTDKTAQIAQKAGAEVIRQFPPQGYGPAMEKALRTPQTPIIVTLDCDDTYPAQQIATFVNYIRSGYDLVDGCRIWRRPKAMPWFNYLANRFFALIGWILTGVHVSDLHSGMRAYRKSMLDKISFDTKHSALPVELLLKPARLGYKYIEIPIEYRLRVGESTLDKWNSTKWTFIRVWKIGHLKKKVK